MCGQRIRIAKDGRSPRTFVNLARCRLVFRVFLVWYGFDLAFGFDFINTSVEWFLKWVAVVVMRQRQPGLPLKPSRHACLVVH